MGGSVRFSGALTRIALMNDNELELSRKPAPERPSQVFKRVARQPARAWRGSDAALVFSFALAICLPLAGLVLHLDTGFELEENRELATFPKLELNRAKLAKYAAQLETFFNDQFGFRKRLIHWLSLVKVAALGVSPSPKVVLGQRGWLFYGDVDTPYYRALTPLSDRQLDEWRDRLVERHEWLAARGIPYLIVFAPLKSTIYPEFMPQAYNRVRNESRLDQLVAYLKAHSNLTVLDLRAPLRDERARHQVYYRTDTHWNNRGAFVGYQQIMSALRRPFPQLEAIPISAFEESEYSEPGRDLPLILGMRPYFWDRYVDLRMTFAPAAHQVQPGPPPGKLWTRGPDMVFERPDERLPRAVMFRDSFATWLIPLLSESFSRIRYTWQYTFDRGIVERERPAIVIQEMVERALMEGAPPS
jgi:hypothetical protein